jgi:hypothetical protein
VAHACNPSYRGGRDQEDLGSKSVPASKFERPPSQKYHTKRADRVAQSVGPEFKSWYRKKKTKKKEKRK